MSTPPKSTKQTDPPYARIVRKSAIPAPAVAPWTPIVDWYTAPQGAQWHAWDGSGMAYWHAGEPIIVHAIWDSSPSSTEPQRDYNAGQLPKGYDWRLTLTQRPAEQP